LSLKTEQYFVLGRVFAAQVMNIVGCDDWNLGFFRQFAQSAVDLFLLGNSVILEFEEKPVSAKHLGVGSGGPNSASHIPLD
jgi:hypothetical protein